jgi:hypothetical protein
MSPELSRMSDLRTGWSSHFFGRLANIKFGFFVVALIFMPGLQVPLLVKIAPDLSDAELADICEVSPTFQPIFRLLRTTIAFKISC